MCKIHSWNPQAHTNLTCMLQVSNFILKALAINWWASPSWKRAQNISLKLTFSKLGGGGGVYRVYQCGMSTIPEIGMKGKWDGLLAVCSFKTRTLPKSIKPMGNFCKTKHVSIYSLHTVNESCAWWVCIKVCQLLEHVLVFLSLPFVKRNQYQWIQHKGLRPCSDTRR